MRRELVALDQGAESLRAVRNNSAQDQSSIFREAAVTRDGMAPERKDLTVRELLRRFSGKKDPRFVERIMACAGSVLLSQMDQARADQSASQLYKRESTRKRQFYGPLLRAWGRAAQQNWCAPPSIRAPKIHRTSAPKWISPLMFDRLARCAAPHLITQMHVLVGTGMMPSDMFNLEWPAIDFDEGVIQLRREDRQARIRPHARAILQQLPRTNDRVILTADGKPYASKKNCGGQSKSAVHKMRELAGCPTFTLTQLVHSFAAWHLALYRDFDQLKRDSGWSEHRLRWSRKLAVSDLDSVRYELLRLYEEPPIGILSAGLFMM